MSKIRKIHLTKGQVTIVDEDDYEYLSQWKWSAVRSKSGSYYAKRRGYNRKTKLYKNIAMHRVINKTPDGKRTDHVDRNSLNNRKSNLRTATRQQNCRNRKPKPGGSSQYKGVLKNASARTRPWTVKLHTGKGCVHESHRTEEDAARAHDELAIEHHREFAYLNFDNALVFDYGEFRRRITREKEVDRSRAYVQRGPSRGKKYKGVDKFRGRGYVARIRFRGKSHHLGISKDPETAARLYDAKAREFHGDDAYLNFPDE